MCLGTALPDCWGAVPELLAVPLAVDRPRGMPQGAAAQGAFPRLMVSLFEDCVNAQTACPLPALAHRLAVKVCDARVEIAQAYHLAARTSFMRRMRLTMWRASAGDPDRHARHPSCYQQGGQQLPQQAV